LVVVPLDLELTCDPVGRLVRIPCVERNAVASVKAITAARLAIMGSRGHPARFDVDRLGRRCSVAV
jgi:L-serine dehydratase